MSKLGEFEQGFLKGSGIEEGQKLLCNAWKVFEDSKQDTCVGNGVAGGLGIAGAERGLGELKKLGFNTPDLTGFDQEAIDHSSGLDKLIHGVKSFFGSKDTVEDKIREHVTKNLSSKEKAAYDCEEKAIEEYNRKWMQWATQMSMFPGSPPEMPKLPMHDEVDRRVRQTEKQITEQIRSEMSPHDRARLDKQMKDYEEAYRESQRIHNPYGTGEPFRRPPEPPLVVRDYYQRVKEAADKLTRKA